MPIFSLLYCSTSLIAAAEHDREIAAILAVSKRWNLDHAITGVLIFAGGRFAQLLEGGESDVRELMVGIAADRRHEGLRTVAVEQRAERRVPDWSLAYAGPSSFVAGHVAPLLDETDDRRRTRAARRLVALMVEFARNDMSRITAF